MATNTPSSPSRPATKVLANLVTSAGIVAAISAYAAWQGLELTNQEITGFVAVVVAIANSVGWKIKETKPSPSAEQTLLDQGWKRPIPPGRP